MRHNNKLNSTSIIKDSPENKRSKCNGANVIFNVNQRPVNDWCHAKVFHLAAANYGIFLYTCKTLIGYAMPIVISSQTSSHPTVEKLACVYDGSRNSVIGDAIVLTILPN